MKRLTLIAILALTALGILPLASAETTYTTHTVTECLDNSCVVTASSAQEYKLEEGKWKHISKAKSWQGTDYECTVKNDDKHFTLCMDFNATHVTLEIDPKGFTILPYTPEIKVYKDKRNKSEEPQKIKKEKLPKFTLFNQKKTVILELGPNEEIHIGETSTNVTVDLYDNEKSCGSVGLQDNLIGDTTGQDVTALIEFNPQIPQGADILEANITFNAKATHSSTIANVDIYADDVDDSTAATGGFPCTYTQTTNYGDWNSISAWTVNNNYTSPDITNVVEEITNRSGYTSSSSITIGIDGSPSGWNAKRQYADNKVWLNTYYEFAPPPSDPTNLTRDNSVDFGTTSTEVTDSGDIELACAGSEAFEEDVLTYYIDALNVTAPPGERDNTPRDCDLDGSASSTGVTCGDPLNKNEDSTDATIDECLDGSSSLMWIENVYVNVTTALPGDHVLVTCEIDCYSTGNEIGISYHDGDSWNQEFFGNCPNGNFQNYSTTVTITDNANPTHYVRCTGAWTGYGAGDTCANGTSYDDNDDMNITIAAAEQSEWFTLGNHTATTNLTWDSEPYIATTFTGMRCVAWGNSTEKNSSYYSYANTNYTIEAEGAGGPTSCDCPTPAADWEWNHTEECELPTCDITGFDVTRVGTGPLTCTGKITADNIANPLTGQNIITDPGCQIPM